VQLRRIQLLRSFRGVFEKSGIAFELSLEVPQTQNDAEQLLCNRPDQFSLGTHLASSSGSAARGSTAHNRCTCISAVLDAISYLLRTGCQWRLLPREFPGGGHRLPLLPKLEERGVWTCIQKAIYERVRMQSGRTLCPSLVIMDSQSVKTHGAWRGPVLRWSQTSQKPQTLHSRRYADDSDRMPSGTGQHVRSTWGVPSAYWVA